MIKKNHNAFCGIYHNNSFSGLPKLPPNTNWYKQLCRYIRKLTIISEYHPMTKLFLPSSVKLLNEKRRHIRSKHWFVFHPYSQLVFYWTYFYGFILTIDLILSPYLCYDGKLIKAIYAGKNDKFFAIILLMLFSALINIAIRLNTGYYVYETKHLVLKPSQIFKTYGFMPFVIDILSVQPILSLYFRIVNLGEGTEELSVRLFHTARLIPLLHKGGLKMAMEFIERCLEKIIKQPTIVLIAKYAVLVLLILHWITCGEVVFFFFLESQFPKFNNLKAMYNDHITFHKYVECLINTAESVFHFRRDIKYVAHFSEIFKMLFGIFFRGYLSAVLINHFLLYYGSGRETKDMICQLNEYAKTNKLPPHLQIRLITYLKNKFRYQYFDEAKILSSLSDHLRMEMKMNSCNPEIERSLFTGIPKSHIGKIIKCFRTEIYLPHDIIINAGSQDDKTYFINNATVFLSGIHGNEIGHLKPGDIFGALCLHPFESFTYSVIADTYVEVFVLSQKNFTNCVLNHAELLPQFQLLIEQFFEKHEVGHLPTNGDFGKNISI